MKLSQLYFNKCFKSRILPIQNGVLQLQLPLSIVTISLLIKTPDYIQSIFLLETIGVTVYTLPYFDFRVFFSLSHLKQFFSNRTGIVTV